MAALGVLACAARAVAADNAVFAAAVLRFIACAKPISAGAAVLMAFFGVLCVAALSIAAIGAVAAVVIGFGTVKVEPRRFIAGSVSDVAIIGVITAAITVGNPADEIPLFGTHRAKTVIWPILVRF